ncbi:hypothetical protein N7475_006578 [Penicillium sp. IBT 31633x]|nr:hypothetical protein N7475_006578 [Penicillium sp. IBT 31633x]
MDAQPPADTQPNQKLHLDSETQGCGSQSTSDSHCHGGSWSLRRLLSRRGSRRYSVLEREPNRLRKRASN